MKQNKTPLTLALTLAAVALSGCGGGSSSSSNSTPTPQNQTLSGTAATGLAMAGGQVTVVNAAGKTASTTVNANGTYSVTVQKGAPYLLKVTGTGSQSGTTEFSFATDASAANTNITPLTSVALFNAAGQKNLVEVYNQWASSKPVTETQVIESAKKVVANLRTQLAAQGMTEAQINALNIFNQKFTPATATTPTTDKLDLFLDQFNFNVTCGAMACTGSYQYGTNTLSWNANISTSGITFNWGGTGTGGTGGTGNYNLKVTTTAAGQTLPTVTVNNIPKPTTEAEFCGGANLANASLPAGYTLNSCSFSGNTGTIAATVSANGFSVSYSVKYEYTVA